MITGETFINYELLQDIDKAHDAGVFDDMGIEGETEERYVSELERRMNAMDEKSVYIAVKTFAINHRETVKKTLEYMEGEHNGNYQRTT